MIAKHVPMRSLGKFDFAGLVNYVTDAQKTKRQDKAKGRRGRLLRGCLHSAKVHEYTSQ